MPSPVKRTKRLFFDCETKQFSQDFMNAKTNEQRLNLVPDLRVACAFIPHKRLYEYYEPTNIDQQKFADRLFEADEIWSFNGDSFDLLVLRKGFPEIFGELIPNIISQHRHFDLMQKFRSDSGAHFNFSLSKMAGLNLGQGKHTSGREMENLDLSQLKIACKSDVDQLYNLWTLWSAGKIKYPPIPRRPKSDSPFGLDWEGAVGPGPGSELSLPDICPACGIENTLFNMPVDRESMTEGQEADYEMGFRLDQMCRNCALLISDGEPFMHFPTVLERLKAEKPWVVNRVRISRTFQLRPHGQKPAKQLQVLRPKKRSNVE